ncbi:hypothetical protein [Curvibacter fontanus]|jgi:hypothetical protein
MTSPLRGIDDEMTEVMARSAVIDVAQQRGHDAAGVVIRTPRRHP